MINRKINCCNPGFNASCALCCGSHNFNASFNDIHYLLEQRTKSFIKLTRDQTKPEDILAALNNTCIEKRDHQAIQCPFIGYIEKNVIGCLAYSTSNLYGSQHDAFFKGTCKIFYCHAWEKLSDDEIIMAAKITGDWFFYTLLIHDIDELKATYALYINKKLDAGDISNLKKRLSVKFSNGTN